jgi:hypothetical protein
MWLSKIASVGSVGGDMLDIHLDNGNILMLETRWLLALPGYAELGEDDRILYPHTDGDSVYWRHGPRISLEEIFALMKANTNILEEA